MVGSACLIFNPVAGQTNPEQDLEKIKSILEPAFALEVLLTNPAQDTGELAQQAIAQSVDLLIVSGGDGTVSAAASALINTSIPLGVIPRGTANAFANALGIPTDLEAACQIIIEGTTRKVDIALCNQTPMLLLAGVGFEAETVANASREAKNRFGILAYILAGFEQLQNLQQFTAQIETEDQVITVSASALTIANAAPPTSILAQGPADIAYDDGLLDLTIVAPSSIPGAIAASYHLLSTALRGNAAARPDIGYLRVRRCRITTDPPQKVAMDGEIIGTTPLEVECVPQGLTVFAPFFQTEAPTAKLEGLPNLEITRKTPSSEEAFPLETEVV